jgi:hypothetical protein
MTDTVTDYDPFPWLRDPLPWPAVKNYSGITPHRCPICSGRGVVPCGFYDGITTSTGTGAGTGTETCRTCKGGGVLWG